MTDYNSSYTSYASALRKKRKHLKERIRLAEHEINNMKVSHPKFIERYQKLNELRIDYKTTLSRIENYGKPRPGLEEIILPKTNK